MNRPKRNKLAPNKYCERLEEYCDVLEKMLDIACDELADYGWTHTEMTKEQWRKWLFAELKRKERFENVS